MNVHTLSAAPPAELAQALACFEAQFTYPLGPGRFFRIAHGDDYPRFFRAMGEAACFVAERQGQVLGTLGAARRGMLLPDGQQRQAVYLGDLKIAPAARGGRTLVCLARQALRWGRAQADAAFSVVMDGTTATPPRYTGRLAIPPFEDLGKIAVLRLGTVGQAARMPERMASTPLASRADACYRALSAGRYACPGGHPAERSYLEPCWLLTADQRACGRLEDTRRAKRLFADDGTEMRSAHLSCFAFADVAAGAVLLHAALEQAARLGFPALFVAVALPDAEPLCRALALPEIISAGATIYGTGLAPGLWNINTAEI